MKRYTYDGNEHRFSDTGQYLGFFYADGRHAGTPGVPFGDWDVWDKEKHDYLLFLEFKLISQRRL